ncbi:MAG: hypothetical protein IKW74_00040, partial [Thermoguttaceae bacterium]|nr:hypothetical protein [Thermoguttaceae bacterium]
MVLICSVYAQTSGGNNYTTSSPELEQVSILTFPFKDVDHKPVVTAIAFTANQSDVIVGGDDAQVYIWNTEDDNTTASFSLVERNDWVRFVDFSPLNDSFATASQDGTISIWDAQDYKLVRTLSPKVVGAKALCYAPNGKVLAVCGYDAKVVLFNPMDGTHIGD